ncbi:MAG: four helix bundle protein [Bdellovibrionales bacterium]|jgi:four helix bundle protein|nr:four helix bundle protein [Bdellovibrionales bacterium]
MLQNSRTFQLSVTFYQECQKMKLSRHLKDQMDRASSSIALNISEGYGKATYRDQRKYFHIALGSLRESQSILILSSLVNTKAYQVADRLGASLYCLIKAPPR